MAPSIALILCFVFVLSLRRYDGVKDPSPALWVPLIWLVIMGSRQPTQWLGLTAVSAVDAMEQGNPLDRTVYLILIVLAIWILMKRSVRWGEFVSNNTGLFLYLILTLVSIAWSETPYVAFKRWVRLEAASFLMILTVLTDVRPAVAVETVIRRFCYAVIPLSIVLIKYYPHLGMSYSYWTGAKAFQGVATSKNILGCLCLVSGTFFVWDFARHWSRRKDPQAKRMIVISVLFMAMTYYLLLKCDSMTSNICLLIGCIVVLAVQSGIFGKFPSLFKWLIPVSLLSYVVLDFAGVDIKGLVAASAGRSADLTGRTELWKELFRMEGNPIVGTGYGSFWVGDRIRHIWSMFAFHPTQAHNGYFEVYLNLGWLGVISLATVLIAGYSKIWKKIVEGVPLAAFGLAFWTILFFYNSTEAAFNGHILWFLFVLTSVGFSIPLAAEAIDKRIKVPSQFRHSALRPVRGVRMPAAGKIVNRSVPTGGIDR